MKNRFLGVSIAILLPFLGQAQPKARFGLVGGISQTWQLDLQSPAVAHALSVPGFSLGAFVNLPFTETMQFQPELAFVRRTMGYTAEQSNSFSSNTIKTMTKANYTIDMVQVPLWFQFGRQTYVGFGLTYGFSIHAQGESDVTTTTSKPASSEHKRETYTADFNQAFQSKLVDIGIRVGHRSSQFGWEVRPSVSMVYNPHFWKSPSDETTFQISGLIMWMK